MPTWVVDGNNVYGSRPDGWWRDRSGAALRLARSIEAGTSALGPDVEVDVDVDVVVVFDGRPVAAIEALARPGFAVLFAERAGRDAADDRIVAYVEDAYADHPDLVVVTADRGLIDRLPPGVRIERPRTFLARLPPVL